MSLKMPDDKFMSTVKVGEKGQIVIPKGARDLFGIEPGDTLLLLGDAKRGIAIPPLDQMNAVTSRIYDAVVGEELEEPDHE